MKEIGQQFKEKREEVGVMISEVASDLEIDSVLIENLEEGNAKAFKDVLELKDFLASYAKYLGLDSEKITEEYNDYLFEKTSRISLEDIKERLSKTKPIEKKVRSPYTILKSTDHEPKTVLVIAIVIILLLLALFYVILRKILIG